jgi:hypothetical protein
MKTRARTAIAILLIVPGVLGAVSTPATQPASATAGRPPGHPPPETTLPDDPPELGEIIERYIEAAGGPAAFERIETRIVRARIVTDLPTWDPPVFEVDTLTVYSEVSGRYLIVHRTPRGTVLEGCDGAETWKRDVEGKAFGTGAVDGRDAWLVDPRFPVRLAEHFPDMAYLGVATLGGRSVHVADVDGDHAHRLYFDAESGLLARLGYNRTIMRYGEVDGARMPFEVEYSRKGGSSTFVFDAVIHDVLIDERLFSAPGSP